MKTIIALALFSLSFCVSSCSDAKKSDYSSKKMAAESEGQICLSEAREALENNDFSSARLIIEKMRKQHRLALNAREAGILLLDSINLFEAEYHLKKVDQLLRDTATVQKDSLQIEFDDLFQKTKFYKRKLAHDSKERKIH